MAVDAGSAIGFPECGSEAWKKREIERMLDNDHFDNAQRLARAVEIAKSEEASAVGKGGEVSTQCPPEDKDKAFWNGYWSAAHNIAHDIAGLSPNNPTQPRSPNP